MPMNVARRKELVEQFRANPKDSGSSEVQVALLTERIVGLTGHLKLHPKDYHSRRGLAMMVSKRTRLLSYLRKTNINRYKVAIERLGLRK